MIGRVVQSADFQRLLAAPWRSRSAHFAVHHVPSAPTPPRRPVIHASSTELSTDDAAPVAPLVDRSPDGHWMGFVIPKRHARRSVTRNLLRRQIRAVMGEQLPQLPSGLWLVRLRSPFSREQFVSAASTALRQAARAELQQLFQRAGQAPVRHDRA
jgi:ribonuclease P protein component